MDGPLMVRPKCMKFKTNHEELKMVTHAAEKCTPKNSPIPVLNCLLFEAKDDQVKVTATDLEMGIECSIPATVEEEGAAAIPAKEITRLVSKLPQEEIIISAGDNNTTVTYNNSEVNLHGYDPNDFPQLPEKPEQTTLNLKQDCFKKMLKQVLFAVSTEETRPIFTGANFDISGEGVLTLVATDTHKLAVCQKQLENYSGNPINCVIPGKTLNQVLKQLDKPEEEVALYKNENQFFFDLGDFKFTTRLLSGNYPNYKMAIPDEYKNEIRAPAKIVLDAVERASLLKGQNHCINVDVEGNNINLKFDGENGSINELVFAKIDGEPINMKFNVDYLKDTLKAAGEDEVLLKFSNEKKPAFIKPAEDEEFFSILMPAAQ